MSSIVRALRNAAGIAVIVILALAACPSRADDPPRQDGDLFVGSASVVDGFGNTAGGIWRVRAGVATLFCASPIASDDPGFWNVPNTVIVDSSGRIVFLAPIGGQNIGLLRCDQPGAPAEKIAAFRQRSAVPSGWTEAFPGMLFGDRIGYLHILKQRVVADDLGSPLKPQVHNGDVYEFVAQLQTGDPSTPGLSQLFRFDTETLKWTGATDLPNLPNPTFNLTSVVAHDGALFMLNEGTLRRTSLPVQIELTGTIGGTDFKLDLGLFGGVQELINPVVDNTAVPNVGGLCKSGDSIPDEVPLDFNGGKAPLEAGSVIYDEQSGHGLVMLTTYGPMPGPYMTEVASALLNDNPTDDNNGYFHDYFNGCIPTEWLQFAPILPFTPSGGPAFANVADVIATAPGGMVGTQFWANQVVRVLPGDHVFPIATLYHPGGIAGYPAIVPSSGTVVYLTIHSPVDVLVTDAAGRRIGVDPATGNPVNDFGQDAYDSGAGEPRVLAIKSPAPGIYSVDVVGTASGPYTVDISAADLKTGASARIRTSGFAAPGNHAKPDFSLGPDSSLAFVNAPTMQSAVSRRIHGAAGAFDLPLSSVPTNPTTEPRQGPGQTVVFTFDTPIAAATAAITEGSATTAAPTFSGNDVIVGLTGVANQQYVTVSLTDVASSDGGSGGSGSVRVGFLTGDANQSRAVTIADLGLVNAQLAQPVTAANFLKDVNASGTLTLADKGITNANLTKALPAP